MKFSICPNKSMSMVLFVMCLTTACSKPIEPLGSVVPQAATAASDASSQPSLVGTLPGGSSKDPPATTSASKSDVSKVQQSNDMPLPGQANDHSTLKPKPTQKTP
jgi:hypothetical protein